MDDFPKPYFVSYTLKSVRRDYVQASFGALLADNGSVYDKARAELRVGTSSFDNTNYIGVLGNRPETGYVSIDSNYDNIRQGFWQLSDEVYKQALEKLAQKKAFREKRNIAGQLDDFSPVRQSEAIREVKEETIDRAQWAAAVRRLSEVFKKYPAFQKAVVTAEFESGTRRYLNSEGSAARNSGSSAEITYEAVIQAKDGFKIERERKFVYASFADVPGENYFSEQAEAFAKEMSGMAEASEAAPYIGPVIFEDQAASEFFNNYLARSFMRPRAPWNEDEKQVLAGEFYDKLGMRVIAPFLAVEDNPLLERYGSLALSGHYDLDDEGVHAQRVELVKKGKLADFLMSRAPVKERKLSNGHGRGEWEYPTGMPGNIIITPSAATTKAKLKAKLIAACKDLDLDYGIVIRRLANFYSPFEAYKVYTADGHEEPVRGFEFSSRSTRALRDVLAASDELYVSNRDYNGVPFSIVAPSVLVQEVELKKTEVKPEKFPYLSRPDFEGGQK